MFDVRKNEGIFFVGTHVPGKALKSEVQPGDQVTLHSGNERILVNSIERLGPARWKGTVHGFEASFATEFNGLSIEDVVEFNEENIFGCSGA